MLHRTVKYDIQEVEPGLWFWTIYQGNRVIRGPDQFHSYAAAVTSCRNEINNGIERSRNPFTGTVR